MSLRLILMRHAKSSWDDPAAADHDRPLNPRGHDAAGRVGRWMAREGYLPDAALVSSALRTRETWDLVAKELPAAPEPTILDALYHASPDVMLRCLRRAQGDTVLMLGHNPGIAAFAAAMVAGAPGHARFSDYPTAATLVSDFHTTSWAEVAPRSGTPRAFVVPRELPEA